MREAFPLYPMLWSPELVPHGSAVRGRLFSVEEVDPSPGRGATAIPAYCLKVEDDTAACVDAFGRQTQALKNQAVRIPIAHGLERLKPLVIAQDGSPSAHLAMIELVAVHIHDANGSVRHLVQVYIHGDEVIPRASFVAPERYKLDVYEESEAYNAAQRAAHRTPDTLPPPVIAGDALEHSQHRNEQGPSDIPHM